MPTKTKRMMLTCALVFGALTLACSSEVTVQSDNATGDRTNSQKPKADDERTRELRNQIEQIAAAAQGRVGVAATLLETGESISFHPDEHFPMQSVYKLPIGMAALQQVDAGKINLAQRVRVERSDFVRAGQHSPVRDKNPNGTELSVGELLRFMVSESDGTASDVLLKLVGGAEVVSKFLNELKVTEIVVANTEKEIGQDRETQYRNWASPQGAIALLRALHERRRLSEQSQALLLKLMIESPTGPKRLKGLLPANTIVAHKTGTSGTVNGVTAATNDIGLVTLPNGQHLAIAVFVAVSPADSTTREGVIARITRAVYDEITQ
ncbi:MAG: class A beta-lactamase, subclass A2 [Pyrinomonadaceae bacterium]